jgi:UDP-N-acetyl-alpha-D-muramoyl-L-alanyl-L-glutamate epimerase
VTDPLPAPQLAAVRCFTCSSLAFDLSTGELELSYTLSGDVPVWSFTERITLPVAALERSPADEAAVLDVLHLLHAVAGVSYFKAAAPAVIDLGPHRYTGAELDLIRGIYSNGLREFAYTNDLESVLTPEFAHAPIAAAGGPAWEFRHSRALVPCGGGKDSIVTTEALRRAGYDPIEFAVNPNRAIEGVIAASGLDALRVRRRLDPTLFELNQAGALNGHIPVTAINSLLAVATALLNDAGPVVMSNESSASIPNLQWHGLDVNHQWSKSLSAELLVQQALASRSNPVQYFSLLRHLNEVQIAARFGPLTSYDAAVTSCNNAFRITVPGAPRWCRDCPKCRFVFMVLAPFVSRSRLEAIFGGNLLEDPTQLTGYRELLGIGSFKPFECVGDIPESLALVRHLAQQPEWKNAAIVVELMADLDDAAPATDWDAVRSASAPTLAPAGWLEALDALG